MAELDTASPLFQAMTGTGKRRGADGAGTWKLLPGEAQAGLVVPAPWLPEWSRGDLESRAGGRFGLNNLHAWELTYVTGVTWARKYGIEGASLEDAGRLCARVVRQPGQRDLLWARLAPSATISSPTDLTTGALVPLAGSLPSTMAQGLSGSGVRQANVDLLIEALIKARENRVKLVFTFLSLGGGGDGSAQTPPSAGDTDYDLAAVDYWTSTVSPGSTIGTGTGYGRFDQLPWSTTHESHPSATAVGGGSILFPATSATASNPWFLDALDPACPYKRFYFGMIAEQAARLLKAAEAAIQLHDESAFTLADVVESIEIFNEQDVMDAWQDPSGARDRRASGEMWGRAYLHAALAFRQILLCDAIKIWMPGIASFKTDAVLAFAWSDKLAFVDGFIHGIWSEAERFHNELGFVDLQLLTVLLPTLVQGCDLHWYHGIDATDPLRHVGHLVIEVGELRSAIISSMTQWWSTLEPPADFPVTVFENGWKLDGDLPVTLAPLRAEEFQAWEVWRRLGGALAGGAVIAGWHPWMAAASEYYDMGLRVDDTPGTEPARSATPRPAWFAYAILAEVLGDRVRSGSMLLPRVSDHADLAALIGQKPELASVVVLEYRLTVPPTSSAGAAWAYLVLLDPSVRLAVSASTWTLLATPGGGVSSPHGIQVYGFSNVVKMESAGNDENLPVDDVTPVVTRLPVGVFTVVPQMEPRLYLSPCWIVWQLVRGVGSTGVGALHARPDWLDDPGSPLPVGDRAGAPKTSG